MTNASQRAEEAATRHRSERLQRRIAVGVTALVHLLLLLLLLSSDPVPMAAEQGGSAGGNAGGALQVTYIDQVPRPAAAARAPPAPRPVMKTPRKAAPVVTRIQAKPVPQAVDPLPPWAERQPEPSEQAAAPPDAPDDTAQREASAPAPTSRPNHIRGQPPGMQAVAVAPGNEGPSPTPSFNRGRGSNTGSGASMEVGGYQVYYEPMYEARLRELRDQGATELSLPLPGTRRRMVCPIEIIVRRGSGACRMVDEYSAELETIPDARQVILMQKIYKQGQEVWSGPGPYR